MRLALRIALHCRSGYRRAVSGVLLIVFVATAAGIPLPIGVRQKKSNEVFLCASSSCSCQTAEQCWRSCCCHSFAEHLAWARANGVRPPAFAIAQARAGGYDLNWLDDRDTPQVQLAKHSKGCCKKTNVQVVHS